MKTLVSKLTVLFVILSFSATAQFSKPDAEFKDAVDGTTLFTLKDSTFFFGARSEPLWYEGSKRIIFDIKLMTADSVLPADTDFMNEDYEIIGKTSQDVDLKEVLQFGGYRKDEFHSAIITGYVSTFDTYVNSRPEDAVSDALSERRGNLSQLLAPIISGFNFEVDNVEGYTVYVLYNKDAENSEDRFPPRLILVMRSSASLIGIISESEYIEANKTKGNEEVVRRYVTWFQRPNPRTTEQFENIIYHYLP